MKLILLFVLLSVVTVINAGEHRVTIEGIFPGAEGKKIRLMKYSDQITYMSEEINYDIIDQEGRFGFRFNTHEPLYIFYRIDHARMGHYVEPGNNYRIEFDAVDFDDLDDRQNPYINPWSFNYSVYNNGSIDKLNKTISEFNNTFDDFILEHFTGVGRRRLNEPFRNFRKHTDTLFQIESINDPFFVNYYKYKYASYYRIANIKSSLRLFEEYIINKPILYENPQYMDFFNSVFDKYLIVGSRNITINDLLTSVNKHNSYNALMDSLGKDTVFYNEVLRELVMLKGLKDMYHHYDFSRRNVYSIVQHVHDYSKFAEHRMIAGNLLKSFTHLQRGYPAPAFMLERDNGEIISVEDYKGKFVLFNFWATWSVACLAEFSLMSDLYDLHNDRVEFISISVDRNINDFNSFVSENNYPWEFIHFNENFELIERYEVYRYPLFVLIDPDGNIVDNIAPFPSRGLGRRLVRELFEWDRRE